MDQLKLKLMRDNTRIPSRSTDGSVGYDIYASLDNEVVIAPGETVSIPSGFAMALDVGYAAFIYARSGLGIKHGIVPANCVGVIDCDYRGEVVVGLINQSNTAYIIKPLDRIAQMVITKCELPAIELRKSLERTERGDGGFGSTGA